MFAPVLAQQGVQNTTALSALLIVLFALGVFLTFKAYVAACGRQTSEIDVKIHYRIIQLFSEGLYKSPTV